MSASNRNNRRQLFASDLCLEIQDRRRRQRLQARREAEALRNPKSPLARMVRRAMFFAGLLPTA